MPGHDKYITTKDYNKCLGVIFDKRLKQAKLATTKYLNTVEKMFKTVQKWGKNEEIVNI